MFNDYNIVGDQEAIDGQRAATDELSAIAQSKREWGAGLHDAQGMAALGGKSYFVFEF